MSNLKPNNKWQIAYILMFAPFLVTIISHIFLGKARLDADTWQITEVLINYQGGFVRRGLIGEIIYQLSNNFGINTIFMVYLFSIASVVIFFYLIIRDTIKKGYSILLLPTAMLLSSLFVSGHWVRKDVFIMLLFYAIVRLLKNKSFINYIAINILLVIGTLSHEIILFIAAPILLISQLSHDNKRINIGKFVKGIATSVVCYFPALIAGILVAINKGNSATAQAIWDSWTCIGVFNSEIQGAIEGIGWTGEKAIEYMFNKNRYAVLAYRILYTLVVFIGCASGSANLDLIWAISDTSNGLMAIPNLIGIIGLSGIVVKTTKEYFSKVGK